MHMQLGAKESRPMAQKLLLLGGIVFIAFNLRPAITSVGPLISYIQSDLQLTSGLSGLLTTLPLIAFAVLSPLAPVIGHKIGNELTILLGIVVLGIGIVVRSSGGMVSLLAGTALAGVGIAICNVLLPGIVKLKFPYKVTLVTGIYTASLSVSAALASGLSIPLAENKGWGWEKTLLFWGILAIAACIFWLPQVLKGKETAGRVKIIKHHRSLLRSAVAWQVAIFMGMQSLLFYSIIAWMPEILYSHGFSRSFSGWMLSLAQFAGIPASFLIPVVAGKLRTQKGLILGLTVIYFLALTGILTGGDALMPLWVILLGFAQGAGFSLALTFLVLRAENVVDASRLSGMAQSLGYLFAAAGPMMIGYLYDHTQAWTLPILSLFAVVLILLVTGLGAARNKYVL